MAKRDIGFGFGKTGDGRSRRASERDARAGNEAVRFAAFVREWRTQEQGYAPLEALRQVWTSMSEAEKVSYSGRGV